MFEAFEDFVHKRDSKYSLRDIAHNLFWELVGNVLMLFIFYDINFTVYLVS